MPVITLQVTGMKCQHCVQSVSKALNALPGVTATVSLEQASATVSSNEAIDTGKIVKAVEAAGYQASVKN